MSLKTTDAHIGDVPAGARIRNLSTTSLAKSTGFVMPLIDVRCENDHVTEAYRPLAMWPATPPCPECGAPTVQAFLPPQTRWTVDPVIVYRAPDGTCRYPGDAQGQSAAFYTKQGYERVEIRGAAEMRAFESKMNRQEYAHAQRRTERLAELRESDIRRRHSELRNMMQGMSERGKAFARAAMDNTNARPAPRAKESGFHNEIYSTDRSNRETAYGPDGRRRQS